MGAHGSYYYYHSVITASHSPMFKVFQNNLHTFSENKELKRTASWSTPLDNSRLLHSKDPTAKEKNCGVVFKIQSKDCERGFVGETARNFRTRLKEHNNSRRGLFTAVDEHFKDTGHTLGMSSTTNITERPLRQYQAPAS